MRKRYALVLIGIGLSARALGAGPVAAGTTISNTATVNYVISGTPFNASVSDSFVVDQLVDDATTSQDAGPVAVPAGAGNQALLFKLTNTGNGSDSFTLASTVTPAAGSGFTPANCRLYFDTDSNGMYSAPDTLYVPGTNDPTLAAGASLSVLAVCDIPVNAGDGTQADVKLTATSKTISGTPGTVKTGGGIGGVDAVAGLSGADASATGTYKAGNVNYAFTTAQTVSDPAGGNSPVSGAVITYTLTVTPSGSASGSGLVVTDPVPANTTYVSGSLTLNGTALGDSATDGDAGDYNVTTPGAISVKLGALAGSGAAQIITFKVTIN